MEKISIIPTYKGAFMINILYTTILKIQKNTIPFLIKTVKTILIFLIKTVKTILIFLIDSIDLGKERVESVEEILDLFAFPLLLIVSIFPHAIILSTILDIYFPNIEPYLVMGISSVTFPITVLMIYLLLVIIFGIITQSYRKLRKI